MMECFCKSKIQLTQEERDILLDMQSNFQYERFETKIGPDGNFVYREFNDNDLPAWFFDKFGDLYYLERRLIWLQNWGSVRLHKDVNRLCSLTIPLTITNAPTDFWDDDENLIDTLLHNGEAYLQDNQISHSVRDSLQSRNFLQITFKDHSYNQVKEMFSAYW